MSSKRIVPVVAALAQGCADHADRERMNSSKPKQPRSFLGVMFDCCRVYNRSVSQPRGDGL